MENKIRQNVNDLQMDRIKYLGWEFCLLKKHFMLCIYQHRVHVISNAKMEDTGKLGRPW